MTETLITTRELMGKQVFGGTKRQKRIGKIRRFVFHPSERRCIGFIVKRPDLLWMFRRKDRFVSLEGYDLIDGRVVIRATSDALDAAACARLGVAWDACVLWVGLPVITENGEVLGTVGSVEFDRETGEVASLDIDCGMTANALLGKRCVPAKFIKGFRRGVGAQLTETNADTSGEDVVLGAIMVQNETENLTAEGGAAEKAGQSTAIALDKVRSGVDKAKPVASCAVKKTGEALDKGAYATGRQIAKSKKMFSDFKKEYDKALHED